MLTVMAILMNGAGAAPPRVAGLPALKRIAWFYASSGPRASFRTFPELSRDLPARRKTERVGPRPPHIRDRVRRDEKLPRYPLVPGFLIGRFAVDTEFQGQGYGARLFHDALRRCATMSREIAAAFIAVDAKNAKLAAWYAGFGFVPTVDASLRLVLPIATVRKVLD
jgi:GNAT superfamily N-acetyltransferase